MTRLRWRLARLIAPEPILRDPFPEEEGAFVILRQDGSLASFRADRFRMKSSVRLDQYDYPEQPFPSFRRARHFVRFVGTIAR